MDTQCPLPAPFETDVPSDWQGCALLRMQIPDLACASAHGELKASSALAFRQAPEAIRNLTRATNKARHAQFGGLKQQISVVSPARHCGHEGNGTI